VITELSTGLGSYGTTTMFGNVNYTKESPKSRARVKGIEFIFMNTARLYVPRENESLDHLLFLEALHFLAGV
jgi:hypothetical protein